MGEVFAIRMGGELEGLHERAAAVDAWLSSLPALPASEPVDPAAVAAGKKLFFDPDVGCTGCHSGPKLTSNATVDVGTGAPFQVPSLRGVAWRAPFLHDGRAATLHDRFGPGGGGDAHGNTTQLDAPQVDALVAYLETL